MLDGKPCSSGYAKPMVIDNAYEVPLCARKRVHTNLPVGIRAEREAYIYQVIIKSIASPSAYAVTVSFPRVLLVPVSGKPSLFWKGSVWWEHVVCSWLQLAQADRNMGSRRQLPSAGRKASDISEEYLLQLLMGQTGEVSHCEGHALTGIIQKSGNKAQSWDPAHTGLPIASAHWARIKVARFRKTKTQVNVSLRGTISLDITGLNIISTKQYIYMLEYI